MRNSVRSALEDLRESALERLSPLHQGVARLNFLDFPDYSNIGDSAISLGTLRYWAGRGITVDGIHPIYTTPPGLEHGDLVLALQGGGTLGGLYPPMETFRTELARRLAPGSVLIQLPQSVVFPRPEDRANLAEAFDRPEVRLAARDQQSFDALREIGLHPHLVPDMAHHLGFIDSPDPRQELVVLARTDPEAAAEALDIEAGRTIDWPRDSYPKRALHRLKYGPQWPPFARRLATRPPAHWEQKAQKRLALGTSLLSAGKTIVTDRLHAMILGLHLGRRVVAVDNSNMKLSNYAATWLDDPRFPL